MAARGPEKRFKFLPHTTDVEFESYGRTLPAAFEAAGAATFSSMTELRKVKQVKRIAFKLLRRGDDVSLLYDFLDKLVFLYDSRRMFFSKFRVSLSDKSLSAEIWGEKISERHPQLSLVKAVTYHEMAVGRKGAKFFCRAIIDI
ncbi:MAG: archease [archaeon]